MTDLQLAEERGAHTASHSGFRAYTVLRDGEYITSLAPRVGDVILTTHFGDNKIPYPRYVPTDEQVSLYGPFK